MTNLTRFRPLSVTDSSPAPLLDSLILRSHSLRLGEHRIHPYLLAADVASVAALVVSFIVLGRHGGISRLSFSLVFVGMLAFYRLASALKQRWLDMPSRSFLQDTALLLLPCYAVVVRALGYPCALAFDLAGVVLPAYLAVVRVGCFLGGCCYGTPSSRGVHYPAQVLRAVSGWRRFRPGPAPIGRVLPVQLIESLGALALCVTLLAFVLSQPQPPGTALPWFFVGYGLLRFVLDYWRSVSARPRIGRWSEAQLFSLVLVCLSLAWLWIRPLLLPALPGWPS